MGWASKQVRQCRLPGTTLVGQRALGRDDAEGAPKSSRRGAQLAAGAIVLVTGAIFANSFGGIFVFDDQDSIGSNPTIRRLWPVWQTLCPPNAGKTVGGRPLLNLSFALNYAISGDEIWSYHALNLAIHILGALLLFGVARRTLLVPSMRESFGSAATLPAFVIALLWAIHPLQTESVTYVVQRAESLVGLFYLLTLYCFIRGVHSDKGRLWYAGAIIACLAGMATKEVMVSAPLMVLLYDRTFCVGSFREAWRRRGLYASLASTWVLLGVLVVLANNRGETAGFGTGIRWWSYLCTQFVAIVHYLVLCVWPSPLVLDYGSAMALNAWEIVPCAVLVCSLGLATAVAIWRWPKAGFLGAWFFAILAPTSSVVPVTTQTVAEHRMYLPLAAVVAAVVLGGDQGIRALVRRRWLTASGAFALGVCLTVPAATSMAMGTWARNKVYHSELAIWSDTVAKAPNNARAQAQLGNVLFGLGQTEEAIAHFRKALEIQPDYDMPLNSLGNVLCKLGQSEEAVPYYQRALEINPQHSLAHNNLGNALLALGRTEEAVIHYRKAMDIDPGYAVAYYNCGNALLSLNQSQDAIVQFRKALDIEPQEADFYSGLGDALASCGQDEEALVQYGKALQLQPEKADAIRAQTQVCRYKIRLRGATQPAHSSNSVAPMRSGQPRP